jgi:xanthine/uracil permease
MQDPKYIARGPDADRSLGDLFGELARETTTLVRQEVRLATTEITSKAKKAGGHAGVVGAGGALVHAGLLAIVAAAVIGLGSAIPMWLSALVIGLVVAGIGYALVRSGLGGLAAIDPAPQQTIDSLKEDKEWLKDQMK